MAGVFEPGFSGEVIVGLVSLIIRSKEQRIVTGRRRRGWVKPKMIKDQKNCLNRQKLDGMQPRKER